MKFNQLIPEFSVSDFKKSLKFYTEVLGFKLEYKRDESKFAMISFQGSQIMIEQVNNYWSCGKLEYPFGRGINFQISVDSVENILERLKKVDYPIFAGVKESWYRQDDKLLGCKEFLIQDPDGYLLRFSEDIGVRRK